VDASFGTVWEAVAARLPHEIAISEPGRDYTYLPRTPTGKLEVAWAKSVVEKGS
jgi:hypothetical protein